MTALCLLALTGAAVATYQVTAPPLREWHARRVAKETAAHLASLDEVRAVPYDSLSMARRPTVVGGCGW